jgi:endonuclease/exonuclease/phosphatase family metal-dependent hydrolase
MCHELSESIDLKQVAVMLVGDFNIASTESLYRKAKKILGTCVRLDRALSSR